ncbi:MAG: ribonucleotide reductase N-terminal alpha domain-containing protein, partial [Ectothiorhodospiraceae bacterium]
MVSARDRSDEFLTPIGREIWDAKYRHRVDGRVVDHTVTHTWHRVARAVAEAESPDARATWTERFDNVLSGFHFLPGGRILAGAGTGRDVTLFNCFVMGLVDDSMDGIFSALREGAITMQKGGGIGYDFSTLRPSGCHARGTGSIASGPVSFMRIWDAMCGTILSTGARRGAMMATLRCDHPDIEIFIGAKEQRGELTRFNLSVQVTDEFMTAVHKDRQWELVFPCEALGETPEHHETVTRRWPGTDRPVP